MLFVELLGIKIGIKNIIIWINVTFEVFEKSSFIET